MIPFSWQACIGLAVALALSMGAHSCTTKDRNAWREKSHGWQAKFTTTNMSLIWSEALRKTEHRKAVAAISEEQGRCDIRVDQARASARTIRTIVERPVRHDPQGCPIRGVIRPADGLRDALQPPGSTPGG